MRCSSGSMMETVQLCMYITKINIKTSCELNQDDSQFLYEQNIHSAYKCVQCIFRFYVDATESVQNTKNATLIHKRKNFSYFMFKGSKFPHMQFACFITLIYFCFQRNRTYCHMIYNRKPRVKQYLCYHELANKSKIKAFT